MTRRDLKWFQLQFPTRTHVSCYRSRWRLNAPGWPSLTTSSETPPLKKGPRWLELGQFHHFTCTVEIHLGMEQSQPVSLPHRGTEAERKYVCKGYLTNEEYRHIYRCLRYSVRPTAAVDGTGLEFRLHPFIFPRSTGSDLTTSYCSAYHGGHLRYPARPSPPPQLDLVITTPLTSRVARGIFPISRHLSSSNLSLGVLLTTSLVPLPSASFQPAAAMSDERMDYNGRVEACLPDEYPSMQPSLVVEPRFPRWSPHSPP